MTCGKDTLASKWEESLQTAERHKKNHSLDEIAIPHHTAVFDAQLWPFGEHIVDFPAKTDAISGRRDWFSQCAYLTPSSRLSCVLKTAASLCMTFCIDERICAVDFGPLDCLTASRASKPSMPAFSAIFS